MVTGRTKYDVRTRVLVELTGDVAERESLEEALASREWKILKKWSVSESQYVHNYFYVLEICFFGSQIGALRGTRLRLDAFRERHTLNLVMHKPGGMRYQRILADANRVGENIDEIRNALEPQEWREGSRARSESSARELLVYSIGMGLWVLIYFSFSNIPILEIAWALSASLVIVHVLLIRWQVHDLSGQRRTSRFRLFVASSLFVHLFALIFGCAERGGSLPDFFWLIPSLVVVALITIGLRLEVRQASWRAVLSWLLPVIAAALVMIIPQFSVIWISAYLHYFEISTDEVAFAPEHLFMGSSGVMAFSASLLAVPALLGTLRHFHVRYVSDRQQAIPHVAISAVVIICWVQFLQISSHFAAFDAMQDGALGRSPKSFYGISPKLVCVNPLMKPTDISGEGSLLNAVIPHLYFGSKNGSVILWSPDVAQKISIPASSVRLVEAKDDRCVIGSYLFGEYEFATIGKLANSGKEKMSEIVHMAENIGARQIIVRSEDPKDDRIYRGLLSDLSAELGEEIDVNGSFIECTKQQCSDHRSFVIIPGAVD